jgi:hypothetical protein
MSGIHLTIDDNLKERDHLGDLGLEGSVILKLLSYK